ncbi:hypothetical protein [Lactiplantibacillus pingfangensis]|uniref:hypothetical protein n=1 Tax=Lactiplantibacillus pingfangensis TaxID=2559915 RepID=UPI0010F4A209|nr:hypothetical protein [Lactiplantibacillus pingfangensis]
MQNWRASTLSIVVATEDRHAAKRTFNNVAETVTEAQITALGGFVAQIADAPFTAAILKTTDHFTL